MPPSGMAPALQGYNPLAPASGDRDSESSACSSSASPLEAPLLRPRSFRASSSSSNLSPPPRVRWHWLLACSALGLLIVAVLALSSHRILALPLSALLGLHRPRSDPSSHPPSQGSLHSALAHLVPGLNSVPAAVSLVSQCLLRGLRCALQLLQTLLAWGTTWLLEPLALALIFDTVLLTLVGLVYQACTKLSRRGGQAGALWSSRPQQVAAEQGAPGEAWPMVLVQLPMYNEREVYARAVASACQMTWPRSRLVIQVLDDSTEEDISLGMRQAVEEWRLRGVDVRYRHRVDRKGYKAGNLREGLQEEYAKDCKYVAVLDADFEPRADWLLLSIPHLEKDRSLALVQTRWTFSNEDECLVTQLQAVELTWHFWAEQLVSSLALRCFGFNGTAGVWRTEAILDAGNWRDDTTVEDMDMAVCAAMRGWKMLMLPEVECLSEVPASYSAYRKQQHRWTSGPASLLRQRFWSIACTPGQALGWGQKVYLVGVYMVLRRSLRHLVGMALWLLLSLWLLIPALCSLVHSLEPASGMPAPGCSLSLSGHNAAGFPFPWATVLFALVYPACLICFSTRKVHLYPAYVLFMNGMLPCRVYAILAGLFDLKSSRTWDVTQKLGKKKSNVGVEADGATGEGRIVVSVEKTGADRASGARLQKRPEAGSKGPSGRVSASGSSSGLASPSSSESKKQQQAKFPQELLMGWCLVVVVCSAAAWTWLCMHSRDTEVQGQGYHSGPGLMWGSVAGTLILQGCWNLWIGGSRWCPQALC